MPPLPINFHATFRPERRHIASLLAYAASGGHGSLKEIGRETAIPMGGCSGKVLPTIRYAVGMGLLEPPEPKNGVWRLSLSPFGSTVYRKDPLLGAPLTQWLAHMNLCRPDVGAVAWHRVFARGRWELGSSFTRGELEAFLTTWFGPGRNRTGPMVSTYLDRESLGRAQVLVASGDRLQRCKAPIDEAFTTGYAAHLLALMDSFFPGQDQVAFSDLNDRTGWFDICLWDQADLDAAFTLIQRGGHLTVDRQRKPWILERFSTWQAVWDSVFECLAARGG